MSIIEEGPEQRVRMAHLAIVGGHTVNGKFSTDRTIKEYADDIWGLKPVQIESP
jgi:glucan phosphorylase